MIKTVDDVQQLNLATFFQFFNATKKIDVAMEASGGVVIFTDTNPGKLFYPEGYCYREGNLVVAATAASTYEFPFKKTNGVAWAAKSFA